MSNSYWMSNNPCPVQEHLNCVNTNHRWKSVLCCIQVTSMIYSENQAETQQKWNGERKKKISLLVWHLTDGGWLVVAATPEIRRSVRHAVCVCVVRLVSRSVMNTQPTWRDSLFVSISTASPIPFITQPVCLSFCLKTLVQVLRKSVYISQFTHSFIFNPLLLGYPKCACFFLHHKPKRLI